MNKRLALVLLIALSVMLFATFIVYRLISSGSHHHNFTWDVISLFAFMLGIAGSTKLKRDGYEIILKYFFLCYIILFISSVLIALIFLHSTRSGRLVVEIVYYSWYAALAGLFPLSLYLKYKLKKSSTESTVADAN